MHSLSVHFLVFRECSFVESEFGAHQSVCIHNTLAAVDGVHNFDMAGTNSCAEKIANKVSLSFDTIRVHTGLKLYGVLCN